MFLAFAINSLVVILVVALHYEYLHQASLYLPRIPLPPRFRIVAGVIGALVAHAIEIWIFAGAYYLTVTHLDWGGLDGLGSGKLMDYVYYSFTVYTTLGFGDIVPRGMIRYLSGIESLTGLVLITWTASFLYLEMRKYWDDEGQP
ncbi:potassium channel family protein [Parahaliea aestuarii]|uniref:Two pore domain potassium channel family protein n=1 Tax=Parahaliea aestuarii TaxID=1852021 RepID=A0A5C8ZVA8_9GAMM|nr:potassium channel family protein [Parahaliea aestuarii]TXS92475.1 two pore domain potassium channel family protein [Parahaliea aestuarii]